MTAFFFIAAALAFAWFVIAYGIGNTHPNPSQTTLIPQIFISAMLLVLCFLAGVGSAVFSFFGG